MLLAKAPFTEMLIAANAIDGDDFQYWIFRPGMLFNATGKWWGISVEGIFPTKGLISVSTPTAPENSTI